MKKEIEFVIIKLLKKLYHLFKAVTSTSSINEKRIL
jgi:hypothetical protein